MDDISCIDKMHYIVDGNGNYYRINGKNQLVVAGSQEEAGVFSFVEANQRIGGGRKAHFYSIIPIELPKDGEEAAAPGYGEEAAASGAEAGELRPFPKDKSGSLQAVFQDRPGNLLPVPTDKNRGSSLPETAEPPKAGQEFAVYEADTRMSLPYDMGSMDWAEYMTHFCYLVSGIRNYQDELNQALSDLDMQICDIMHYIELYQVDEAESVWMVRLLKECREQRRDVKDEMLRVEYFQRAIGTNGNMIRAKEGISLIKKLESRFYHPRRLKELFQGSHVKTVRANKLLPALGNGSCMEADGLQQAGEGILLPGGEQMENATSWKRREGEYGQEDGCAGKEEEEDNQKDGCAGRWEGEDNQEDGCAGRGEREDNQEDGCGGRGEGGYNQEDAGDGWEEEGTMENGNTRRETIFDGKDNDWREFARMQLEFYANAEQYMQNLQIDLDEIDDRIEQTLREVEEANYNVAQGYKVFKRLKDLRNERKRKQKEWECVGILVEEFDCGAMADVMEYCLEEIEAVVGLEPGTSKADPPKTWEEEEEGGEI